MEKIEHTENQPLNKPCHDCGLLIPWAAEARLRWQDGGYIILHAECADKWFNVAKTILSPFSLQERINER